MTSIEHQDDAILDLRLIIKNKRLYEIRKKMGLTRKELALLTGVCQAAIIGAETAKRVLSYDDKTEIASALNVDANWIFPKEIDDAIKEGLLSKRHKTISDTRVLHAPSHTSLQIPETLTSIEHQELLDELERAIEKININDKDRAVEIIKSRFGFYGDSQTLDQLAERFGITRERVRQIEQKCLRLLRNPYISRRLKDFLL